MKALTIRQPWVYCITHLGKRVENRTWKLPEVLRGQQIAIHAAKGMTKTEYMNAGFFINDKAFSSLPEYDSPLFIRSAIVAVATLVDCVQLSFDPWFEGPFGFQMRDPIILPEPILVNGKLSFWTVPEDIEEKIRKQL